MNARFFTSLRNFRVSENLGRGEKFGNLRITNDPEVIRALIPAHSLSYIGQLELNALCDGSSVFYEDFEISSTGEAQNALILRASLVQTFLMALWMDRDAAANVELSYLVYGPGYAGIDSNFLGVQFTNSQGKTDVLNLSRQELRDIRLLGAKLFDAPAAPLESSTRLTSAAPRLSRGLYFVNGARSVNDLGIKVAHYCTAFETLLSTSHTELAHQLSERISFLLADSTDERIAIYRNVKEAYTFRSKVVHGATMSEKQIARLAEVSSLCDLYARELFARAITRSEVVALFELSPEKFDAQISRWVLQGTHLPAETLLGQ